MAEPELQDDQILFPNGTAFGDAERHELLEYYRLLAQNADSLSNRKQALNSFFLSINSMFLAGIGLMGREIAMPGVHRPAVIASMSFALLLALAGLAVCRNWSSLIATYMTLFEANLSIAKRMEKHMLVAICTAQMGHRSQTGHRLHSVEKNVARAFMFLHSICIVIAALIIAVYQPPKTDVVPVYTEQQQPAMIKLP